MKHFLQAFRPIGLDFLSTIFFVAFYAATGNLYWAIALGIGIGVAQIGFIFLRGKKPDAMQWASLALVVVLGGASFLTHDPRFAMIKPSVGGFAIGCVMMRRNWMGRYMPDVVKKTLPPNVTLVWGYVWAASFFLLAGVNVYVAYTYGPAIWAWYTAVVPTTAHLGLFFIQYAVMRSQSIRAARARNAASSALNGASA